MHMKHILKRKSQKFKKNMFKITEGLENMHNYILIICYA